MQTLHSEQPRNQSGIGQRHRGRARLAGDLHDAFQGGREGGRGIGHVLVRVIALLDVPCLHPFQTLCGPTQLQPRERHVRVRPRLVPEPQPQGGPELDRLHHFRLVECGHVLAACVCASVCVLALFPPCDTRLFRGAVHADGYQEAGLDMDQPGSDSFFRPDKLQGGARPLVEGR